MVDKKGNQGGLDVESLLSGSRVFMLPLIKLIEISGTFLFVTLGSKTNLATGKGHESIWVPAMRVLGPWVFDFELDLREQARFCFKQKKCRIF